MGGMKLWKISCPSARYDTYDSAVVVAASAKEARQIHPSGKQARWKEFRGDWASDPDQVHAQLIGATTRKRPGVVVASFNAG